MPGKCAFQDLWLSRESSQDLSKWLRPVIDDKYRAYCAYCKSKFDVSHSGFNAVKTHEKGKKHQELSQALLQGRQTTIAWKTVAPDRNVENSSVGTHSVASPCIQNIEPTMCSKTEESPTVQIFLVKDEVTKAEILWALNKVFHHSSDRSAGNACDLFRAMFSDSLIAQKFQMHKDKLGYMITYGLGPYYQEKLAQEVKKCDYFSISVDESLNKISQKGQMDLVVRYWDLVKNEVSTRYLTSTFLGRSTSEDLLTAFSSTLAELGLSMRNIMQISMDGPNVNLKFLNDFQHLVNAQQTMDDPKLIDIGTCALHIIHGSYKTAHNNSGWQLNNFLRAVYYLFKDFPARRAEYTNSSGSSLFPQKMCSIRWVENSDVIDRAMKIIPSLKLYIKAVEAKPPATRNFETVKSFVSDELLPAKLAFMQTAALELEPFLIRFQSDKPLLPFLYAELYSMMHSIASRILKPEIMAEVKNANQLLDVDVNKKENQLNIKRVDIGFGAAAACRGINESKVIPFKRDCRDFLIAMYLKLNMKSPLRKQMVKGASCLSPSIMLNSALRTTRLAAALDHLVLKKHMAAIEADVVKKCYLRICDQPTIVERLKTFDWKKQRLDVLFAENFGCEETNTPFLKFSHKILSMFHGNATVERGFSINRECLVENLHENSLIAQRSVYSEILSAGGILNMAITKSVIAAVRRSSSKRKDALAAKKRAQDEEANQLKYAFEELKNLKEKKRKLIVLAKEEQNAIEAEIAAAEKKLKRCGAR